MRQNRLNHVRVGDICDHPQGAAAQSNTRLSRSALVNFWPGQVVKTGRRRGQLSQTGSNIEALRAATIILPIPVVGQLATHCIINGIF